MSKVLLVRGVGLGSLASPIPDSEFVSHDAAVPEGRPYQDPDTWLLVTEHAGSWWPRWERWLAERSGERVAPSPTPAGLAFAPALRSASVQAS